MFLGIRTISFISTKFKIGNNLLRCRPLIVIVVNLLKESCLYIQNVLCQLVYFLGTIYITKTGYFAYQNFAKIVTALLNMNYVSIFAAFYNLYLIKNLPLRHIIVKIYSTLISLKLSITSLKTYQELVKFK